jgi:hypothetical protein
MGWTVYYRAVTPTLDQKEVEFLKTHVDQWTSKLDAGSESYWWEVLDEKRAAGLFGSFDRKTKELVPATIERGKQYLWGFTKIQFSSQPKVDFATLLKALKELALARPTWAIRVSDDYEVVADVDPKTLENPDELF